MEARARPLPKKGRLVMKKQVGAPGATARDVYAVGNWALDARKDYEEIEDVVEVKEEKKKEEEEEGLYDTVNHVREGTAATKVIAEGRGEQEEGGRVAEEEEEGRVIEEEEEKRNAAVVLAKVEAEESSLAEAAPRDASADSGENNDEGVADSPVTNYVEEETKSDDDVAREEKCDDDERQVLVVENTEVIVQTAKEKIVEKSEENPEKAQSVPPAEEGNSRPSVEEGPSSKMEGWLTEQDIAEAVSKMPSNPF